MNTAQIILNQIKATDRFAMMAWGATQLQAEGQHKHYSGALHFKVNGLACKRANIVIKHNQASDMYELEMWKMKKGEPFYMKADFNIFADQLVSVLDQWIEGKAGKDLTLQEAWTGIAQ